jgi:ABC-type multidrug transport system fused ATPase/permease subunit
VVLCGPAPFLFRGTLGDNLRFADRDAGDADLRRALVAARCDELADEAAGGLEAPVAERGVSLSGGQRQRVALARAVLARPSVLLVDGGTAALDPATEVAVVAGVRRALPGTTLLLVTPHAGCRSLADQVLVLRDRSIEVVPAAPNRST